MVDFLQAVQCYDSMAYEASYLIPFRTSPHAGTDKENENNKKNESAQAQKF